MKPVRLTKPYRKNEENDLEGQIRPEPHDPLSIMKAWKEDRLRKYTQD